MSATINIDDVQSVYSGSPGCCCGCRGKHYYASKYRDESSRERGYDVRDDEVNDGMVRKIVKMLNATQTGKCPSYVWLDTPGRVYIAYFRAIPRTSPPAQE